jgi:hypothetical protein
VLETDTGIATDTGTIAGPYTCANPDAYSDIGADTTRLNKPTGAADNADMGNDNGTDTDTVIVTDPDTCADTGSGSDSVLDTAVDASTDFLDILISSPNSSLKSRNRRISKTHIQLSSIYTGYL